MDNTEYDPADIKVLTDAAPFLMNDYRVLAEKHAEACLFASAMHDMKIAAAAARIVATRQKGTPLGLQYAIRAAECEAAAAAYLAQPSRKGWDKVSV